MINRRAFLRAGIGTAGIALLSRRISPARVSSEPKRIVIIGAGLSGLVAAYELGKTGNDVIVLEAQSRGGGRVLTLRTFSEGHYAEAGAARIFHDNLLTHKYVSEFNLPLITFYPKKDKFVRLKNGKAEHVGWRKFADATAPVMILDKPEKWHRIRGGNDQLPAAFISRLGSRVKYNSPVVAVDQDGLRVTVKVSDGSTVRADAVICAVPFTVLNNIIFSPPLSADKVHVMTSQRYDAASRIFIETRERFWTRQKLNGFGFGERFDEVWDSTFAQPGTSGILQSYTREPFASAISAMSERERIDAIVLSLEKLFPEIRGFVTGGQSKCWSNDPWAKGGWAHLTPDQKMLMSRPEGRVFFAGEHLSDFPSWMNGAFQSGLGCVSQVQTALSIGRAVQA